MTDTNPTNREQLLYITAREFEDNSAVFTGFHWPLVATRVARRLHAPELQSIYEAGIVQDQPTEMVATSTTEAGVFDGSVGMYGTTLDSLQTFLKSDSLDGAVIDAANVDRFGNVNSSVIGEYDEPAIRLPGPGGARDVLSYGSNVTLVCGSTEATRYQERVDHVSSPGQLNGDGSREAAGFAPDTGPQRLLTPLGRFVFDESGRAQLDALAVETTVEDVRELTGWPVEDGSYARLPLPNERELRVVREEMQHSQDRGYRSIRP